MKRFLKKRLLMACLVLAAGLAFAGGQGEQTGEDQSMVDFENADPFGRYEETVILRAAESVNPADQTLPAGDSFEDNYYTRYVKEHLNIEVVYDWVVSSSDYGQKLSISIASNDLPDALIAPYQQFQRMAANDQLQDIGRVYDAFASDEIKSLLDLTNGAAIDAVTIGGKMLGLPQTMTIADQGAVMWIRQDWLDELGLEVPQTVPELEEVLTAFVENDMGSDGENRTIGLTGPQAGASLSGLYGRYGFGPIFTAFDVYPGQWVEDGGEIVYGSIMPEMKEALATLRRWYDEGLIDPEMAVRNDSSEPIIAGRTGVFFGPWWSGYNPIDATVKNDPSVNYQAYLGPAGPNGDVAIMLGPSTSTVEVINKNYAYPDAVIKMQNLLKRDGGDLSNIQDEYGSVSEYYPLRLVLSAPDVITFTNRSMHNILAGRATVEEFQDEEKYINYALLAQDAREIMGAKRQPYGDLNIEHWNIESPRFNRLYSIMVGVDPLLQPYEGISSIIYHNTETMERKWANLEKLEEQTFYSIIFGEAPLSAFDEFVEQWKSEGGDEITVEVADYASQ